MRLDVKKRSYFGDASMDAEISLLMANQTLVRVFLTISEYTAEPLDSSNTHHLRTSVRLPLPSQRHHPVFRNDYD